MEAEPIIASSEEVSELFSTLDWGKLWPRMVGHTLATLKRRYQLKGSKDELHDIVRELVEECLHRVFVTERRKWNKTHYEEPEKFLFDVLDSLVSNWLTGKKNRLKTDGKADLDLIEGDSSLVADSSANRDELLREFTTQLEKLGAEDDEMLIFNARVHDGLTKPEEIRDDIGMTEKEYHNAVRRLDRRLQKIRENLDL